VLALRRTHAGYQQDDRERGEANETHREETLKAEG
jgi:hypothetical protein